MTGIGARPTLRLSAKARIRLILVLGEAGESVGIGSGGRPAAKNQKSDMPIASQSDQFRIAEQLGRTEHSSAAPQDVFF
jgi:hypothetical protein